MVLLVYYLFFPNTHMNKSVNTYLSLLVIGAVSALAMTVVQARVIDAVANGSQEKTNRRSLLRLVTPDNSTVAPRQRAIN